MGENTALKRIFTYGTLKHGHRLNRLLDGSEFLGDGKTVSTGYKLYDNGSYPYLQDAASNGYSVKGEVYEVDSDTLKTIDQIELGAGYIRDFVAVNVGGQVFVTEAYLWPVNRTLERYPECEPQGEFKR